jgi:hypothetical protein
LTVKSFLVNNPKKEGFMRKTTFTLIAGLLALRLMAVTQPPPVYLFITNYLPAKVTITVTSPPNGLQGHGVSLETSTNLATGNWTVIATTNATTAVVVWTNLPATNFARFYRAAIE